MGQYKNRLNYAAYFVKNAWFVMLWKLFRRKKGVERFLGQKGISQNYGEGVLRDAILSEEPFAAIRFGAVELSCINNYEKITLGMKKTFKPSVRFSMKNNAGFFPTDDESLKHYCTQWIKDVQKAEIIGISGIHMEDYFFKKFCPGAKVIQYQTFEPLRGHWTNALRGKRVLVISPFAQEIKEQYARRNEIIQDDNLLPEFHLETVQSVLTLGDQKDPRFETWFEALDHLKVEILKHDFDIALVGAGAYGAALCLFIRQLNKQAIQTGGATQLLFGIMGKRWEKRPYVTRYVTSAWTRPLTKPEGADKVEKGCYW